MAFLVEDGTGVEGSTSYLSVVEADALMADLDLSVGWVDLTTQQKEKILEKSSFEFDQLLRWRSSLIDLAQGLDFPRVPFEDINGRSVEGITKPIKRSVITIAAEFANDTEENLDVEPINITQKSFGDSSETYSGSVQIQSGGVIQEERSKFVRLGYGNKGNVTTVWRA